MRFFHTAVMALAATQTAALSSKDIVAAIDGITKLSGETAQVAKDIDPTNLFQSVPKLIGDFKDIVVLALQTIENVGTSIATTKIEDSGQEDICEAFHDFVKVHQNLLQTVIGQGGILSKTPISAPLGAVLSVLEGGVDTLADSLLGLIPTCADQAKQDLMDLDATIEMTIDQLASQVPGAKPLIQLANNFIKGLTGGIGGAASSLIGIFTGKGGGPLGSVFGGSDNMAGGSMMNPGSILGGLLGGLLGGGKDMPASGSNGAGGLLGGLLGGGKDMPASGSNGAGGLLGGLLGGDKGMPASGSNMPGSNVPGSNIPGSNMSGSNMPGSGSSGSGSSGSGSSGSGSSGSGSSGSGSSGSGSSGSGSSGSSGSGSSSSGSGSSSSGSSGSGSGSSGSLGSGSLGSGSLGSGSLGSGSLGSGSLGSGSSGSGSNMAGSLPSGFPGDFPDVTGSIAGSISGSFPKGPNGQMPNVKKDNMGGYYVCYHVEAMNSMMTMKRNVMPAMTPSMTPAVGPTAMVM